MTRQHSGQSANAGQDVGLQLRDPSSVMRLTRLGAIHQTRLSFMRCLLRRIADEKWRMTRPLFEIDENGYGTAVYKVETPAGTCSLVAFSQALSAEERTDRVIAEKWDATFALMLGEPGPEDVERLRANVPKQEAGRCSPQEAVLSRANKSVRLFEHIVECLAAGEQPSIQKILEVGYLMRTTAVYGNGKFGMSDLSRTFGGRLFSRPFEPEMLSVYLTREFTIDLVERAAEARAPETAVRLDPQLRHALGIGNSTGLGMAPYLVAHPALFHRWNLARETAIARVCALPVAEADKRDAFRALLDQAIAHVDEWETADDRQSARVLELRSELRDLRHDLDAGGEDLLARPHPWRALVDHLAETYGEEAQELVNSLILEPYGDLVDDLADTMSDPESESLDPTMTLERLRALIEAHYDWALGLDFTRPEAQHFFWYRSEEKEEPRLGERAKEPGVDKEMRVTAARDVQALHRVLAAESGAAEERVGAFLLRQPQWRFTINRVQVIARHPYGEIRDNLLAADCVPVDLLRCKLAYFGASKFDPKSDRWTRIAMFQGAPFFQELAEVDPDDWAFPVFLSPKGRRSQIRRHAAAKPEATVEREAGWGEGQEDPGLPDLAEGAKRNGLRHSGNEIFRITQKAVEGSGAAAGLDIDTAKAAVWLSSHGFSVLETLAVELERASGQAGTSGLALAGDGKVEASGKPGAVLATPLVDLLLATAEGQGGTARLHITGLSSPLFLLAAAARHLRAGWHFRFDAVDGQSGTRFVLTAAPEAGFSILAAPGTSPDRAAEASACTVEAVCAASGEDLPPATQTGLTAIVDAAAFDAAARRSLSEGIPVAPETWRRLWKSAKKVLVPASEQSRLRGAGSMSSDSD